MAATAATKRKRQQRQASVRLLILVAILVCINVLAGFFHYGIDLTSEKRFTLSPSTKKMLRSMDDVAVVTVFLKGDNLPAEWKRLQQSVRDRLQTFREFAGKHIAFRFIDPFEDKSDNELQAVFKELSDKGIYFIPVMVGDNQSRTEQKVFPFALVNYRNREMTVNLIENHTGMDVAGVLNYSESMLEYKFASAIQKLSIPDKPRIGYIMGHGEPLGFRTHDALSSLQKYYTVDTIDLPREWYIPTPYDLIIINKPALPFDERDQFKIDQYIMNGGKVLWSIDMLNVPMDTLMHNSQYLATEYGLELDDMLFKYGVRLNGDLIEDRQCNTIPIIVPGREDRPSMVPREWPLLPIFTPTSKHPIVNNLDAIKGIMAGTIDTIANPEIRKTILLESSKYSRTTPSPVRINLAMLMQNAPQRYEQFNKPYQPVAVLLEGKFQSLFRNRLHPGFMKLLRDSLKRSFKPAADKDGAMIVVADGDMFLNDYSTRMAQPLDMGEWQWSNPPEVYANKAFFLNCVEYLTDSSGILEARSKNIRLRRLDADRVLKEKSVWQILNTALPVGLVLVFASVYFFFRKRRYEVKM